MRGNSPRPGHHPILDIGGSTMTPGTPRLAHKVCVSATGRAGPLSPLWCLSCREPASPPVRGLTTRAPQMAIVRGAMNPKEGEASCPSRAGPVPAPCAEAPGGQGTVQTA